MKFDIEMCYGLGVTVSSIEANSEEEAIGKAKKMVSSTVNIMDGLNVEAGCLEFEQVTYVGRNNL